MKDKSNFYILFPKYNFKKEVTVVSIMEEPSKEDDNKINFLDIPFMLTKITITYFSTSLNAGWNHDFLKVVSIMYSLLLMRFAILYFFQLHIT
jgi:hypothetical protein